ncbi:hypothetical protein OD522_004892 [Salmonella enterica]|nr:hypothetical protein [Salmonella enterica]EJA5857505.1 hypothetical protein [Salmonella enterica]EJF5731576.1 hypothetical protein [Salmonella enterica]EJU3354142.1 hypothetical protein [Salmonella enterica]EJX4304651.1 hypothetical protein [Salmonella enterica]
MRDFRTLMVDAPDFHDTHRSLRGRRAEYPAGVAELQAHNLAELFT